MVIVILLVVLTVLVTANWYLWRRLFRDTTRAPGLARRAGAVLIAGGWALAVGALVAERAGAPFWLQRTLAWPGFLWLALSIYLLLTVVAGEAVRPLLRWFLERRAARVRASATAPATAAGIPRPEPVPAGAGSGETGPSAEPAEPAEPGEPRESGGSGGSARDGGGVAAGNVADPSRRVFVSRVVAGAAAAVAVGTVGAGTYGVLNGPAVKRVTVPLAKLPRAAHGFRIAVVSDIHLGPVLGRGFAQKVVDTI
ncbi:MAG: metallophosphoesterase, partial [Streptomyces sp.]|nr:metallophosphoesterase [Streptomyces sp.]